MEFLKKLNILLVEDDDNLRNELSETLKIFFNNVYIAENGKKALSIFNDNKINVVFTDYVMPEMDGHIFSQNIRQLDKNIPIIFLTNYTDKDKLLKLITLNITDFLIKPINYNSLIESLGKLNNLIKDESPSVIAISENVNFDKEKKVLLLNDEAIKLTKNEIVFLELLTENINSVVGFDTLSYSFGDEFKSEHAIKNIVYRLNQKVKIHFIKNIQGVGYKIEIS